MTKDILTNDELDTADRQDVFASHRAQAARIEELEAGMYGPCYEKQLAAQRLCDTERRIDEDVIK